MPEESNASFESCERALSQPMPVPDAYKTIQSVRSNQASARRSHWRLHRERAACFPRCDRGHPWSESPRDEKTGARRRVHLAISGDSLVYSDAAYEMVRLLSQKHHGDKNRLARLSSNWKFRITAFFQNVRLSREEQRMVLAGTNGTESEAVVTQLRGAWDDQDLRGRHRGSKSHGVGRTVHIAEAETPRCAEQIAHSISGDGAEVCSDLVFRS